jgi:hypothetical protein
MRRVRVAVAAGALAGILIGAAGHHAPPTYKWTRVADSVAFPGAYNFPVFVVGPQMWAFHPRGNWWSTDGVRWQPSSLKQSGLNPGYQHYVLYHDAVYSLGTMSGNYLDMHLSSRIERTRDFKTWELLATQSELPVRVFYGAVVFHDRIWLMGGFDGKDYHSDVWNSRDGVKWTRVTKHAGWSERNVDMAVVFKDRIWVIGGGVIDGQPETNPESHREVWSSADGVTWTKGTVRSGESWGGVPVVYDDRLWLIGANRNKTFAPATLVTDDMITWREDTAPWPARGAPAVWVFGGRLYLTGGKYSVMENGTPRFLYYNDVWSMGRPDSAAR